jgi:hypothetical protein
MCPNHNARRFAAWLSLRFYLRHRPAANAVNAMSNRAIPGAGHGQTRGGGQQTAGPRAHLVLGRHLLPTLYLGIVGLGPHTGFGLGRANDEERCGTVTTRTAVEAACRNLGRATSAMAERFATCSRNLEQDSLEIQATRRVRARSNAQHNVQKDAHGYSWRKHQQFLSRHDSLTFR